MLSLSLVFLCKSVTVHRRRIIKNTISVPNGGNHTHGQLNCVYYCGGIPQPQIETNVNQWRLKLEA